VTCDMDVVDNHLLRKRGTRGRRPRPVPADGQVEDQIKRVIERPSLPRGQVVLAHRPVNRPVNGELKNTRVPVHCIRMKSIGRSHLLTVDSSDVRVGGFTARRPVDRGVDRAVRCRQLENIDLAARGPPDGIDILFYPEGHDSRTVSRISQIFTFRSCSDIFATRPLRGNTAVMNSSHDFGCDGDAPHPRSPPRHEPGTARTDHRSPKPAASPGGTADTEALPRHLTTVRPMT